MTETEMVFECQYWTILVFALSQEYHDPCVDCCNVLDAEWEGIAQGLTLIKFQTRR